MLITTTPVSLAIEPFPKQKKIFGLVRACKADFVGKRHALPYPYPLFLRVSRPENVLFQPFGVRVPVRRRACTAQAAAIRRPSGGRPADATPTTEPRARPVPFLFRGGRPVVRQPFANPSQDRANVTGNERGTADAILVRSVPKRRVFSTSTRHAEPSLFPRAFPPVRMDY